MYARIGSTVAAGGVLATTGSNVPFAADFIAAAALLAAGMLLLRLAYLARSRAPRHAGRGGRSAAAVAGPFSGPATRRRRRHRRRQQR